MEINKEYVKIKYCEEEGCAQQIKHYKDKSYELQDVISKLEIEIIRLIKQIASQEK